MTRYVGGHVSIAGGLANSVSNSISIKASCLQIFAGSPRLWYRKLFANEDVSQFLDQKKQAGLGPVFIHALYLVNLASDNPELLKKSIDSLVLDTKNGDQIDCSGVVIHIGSHQGRGFDSVKDQIVKSLQEILSATKKTPLLLECAAGQKGKVGSLAELSYLIGKIRNPRVGICLDTAHLFEGGYDLRDPKKTTELTNLLSELSLLDKVKLIHLNDSATDFNSARDNHADLGKGKIGLDGLKNFVNQDHFLKLPLILETPGPDKMGPDLENINIAKSL